MKRTRDFTKGYVPVFVANLQGSKCERPGRECYMLGLLRDVGGFNADKNMGFKEGGSQCASLQRNEPMQSRGNWCGYYQTALRCL